MWKDIPDWETQYEVNEYGEEIVEQIIPENLVPTQNIQINTIYDLFKYAKEQFFWPKEQADESMPPVKKIVSNATIRIYRYENYPQYYVIYFDNVGAGFYLDKNYFPNTEYRFD